MGLTHLRALTCALAAILIVAPLAAHEIGTTRVHVLFRADHTYRIDVVTAPQALLTKLEVAAHRPRSPQLARAELHTQLQRFAPSLARAAEIRFGATASVPHVDVLPVQTSSDPSVPTSVTVRYSGQIPTRVATFTWGYHLTYAAYALAVQNEGDALPAMQWLDGAETSRAFPLAARVVPPTRWQVAQQYLALGFTHILPHGLDHILFVLGIFLLTTKLKPMLTQVTTFTIAHSITLALTMYGVVSLSSRIVEPAIALSIAYIAIENIFARKLSSWRVAVIFAFGLLHGMGFAGVLRELGLPRSEFVTALVTFNLGVEVAQLTVIALATLLFAYWYRERDWYRGRFVVPASMLIALTGVFWTIQRAL
ncbi:MAG TPA: HupE/UreJ family protein [Thermoanaerobaculia bacterium]|nr:HupE/UreJ family protein [Thermoanaerobaculia bacterium]